MPKGHRLEKSTPSLMVAVVTNMTNVTKCPRAFLLVRGFQTILFSINQVHWELKPNINKVELRSN